MASLHHLVVGKVSFRDSAEMPSVYRQPSSMKSEHRPPTDCIRCIFDEPSAAAVLPSSRLFHGRVKVTPPTTSLQSIQPERKPARAAKTNNNVLLFAKRREKSASKTGYSFPVIPEWSSAPPARCSSDGKGLLCEQPERKMTTVGIDNPNIYQILRTLERLEEDSNTPNRKRRRRPVVQTAFRASPPAWGKAPYPNQPAMGQTNETARGLQIRPGCSSTRLDESESKQAADDADQSSCVDPDRKTG